MRNINTYQLASEKMLQVSALEGEDNCNNGASSELVHQISLAENVQEPKEDEIIPPLNKQNSIFSLTLGEIQCKSGRSFGSMNMEEFIANIWSVEENSQLLDKENHHHIIINNNNGKSLSRQGSFSIPLPLSKKTVDEIWLEMQKDDPVEQLDNSGGVAVPERQQTLGEMSLEDFLVKVGVVQESLPRPEKQRGNRFGDMSGAFAAYQVSNSTSYGNGTETSTSKSKRRIIDGPPEVVVERRQRRMIKNRESAARSRARKQAYTVELEVELNQLKQENERLKHVMAEADLKRKQEVLTKRKQQETKGQKLVQKLKAMRRATSLAW